MSSSLKYFLKSLCPPLLLNIYKSHFNHKWLLGSYNSWSEAEDNCSGYDEKSILDKVRASTLLVKQGKVAYERDSVTFSQPQYSYQILSGIFKAAALKQGQLFVLDFGGSLGSTYFQHKIFLTGLKSVEWKIVEQSHFVECGREEFSDSILSFHESIDAACTAKKPNVVLLSSVLPYLPDPYKKLEELIKLNPEIIIIGRTPFHKNEQETKDLIKVQHVPAEIYSASYPLWIFSEKNIFARLFENYRILSSFKEDDNIDENVQYKGFIFEKINP